MLVTILAVVLSLTSGFLYGMWRGSKLERGLIERMLNGDVLIMGFNNMVQTYSYNPETRKLEMNSGMIQFELNEQSFEQDGDEPIGNA